MGTARTEDEATGSDIEWHTQAEAAVFDATRSAPAGLTNAEARARLDEHGFNELAFTAATPWWRVLARQFASPIIGILAVAALITLLQRHWVDAIAILLVLAINAALGFTQERKAEKDVRALQSMTTSNCRV